MENTRKKQHEKLTVVLPRETLETLKQRQELLKRDGLHVSLSSIAHQAIAHGLKK